MLNCKRMDRRLPSPMCPQNGLSLNGFLPFVPQVGHIYTLSCKVSALSGGTNFLAMGFAVKPLTNGSYRNSASRCGMYAHSRKRYRSSASPIPGRLRQPRHKSSHVWNHHQSVHSRSGHNYRNRNGERLDVSILYQFGSSGRLRNCKCQSDHDPHMWALVPIARKGISRSLL